MNWAVIFDKASPSSLQGFPATRKQRCSPRRAAWKISVRASAGLMWTAEGIETRQHEEESRFDAADGAWRAALAFDALRQAIVLVAGDKSDGSPASVYRRLIATADKRFNAHVAQQRKGD